MNTLYSIVHTVGDLDAATALYRAMLDTEPHTATPHYVGFNVGGLEIGLTPGNEHNPPAAPIPYVGVADVSAALEAAVAAGGIHRFGPQDVGGGAVIATVTDGDGSVLGLIQR